uniref:KIB1-4 beta-propeller domain-containing protein n=1 Tax=Brassica campestris TaxID=3711 RepID=M4DB40_BRACM
MCLRQENESDEESDHIILAMEARRSSEFGFSQYGSFLQEDFDHEMDHIHAAMQHADDQGVSKEISSLGKRPRMESEMVDKFPVGRMKMSHEFNALRKLQEDYDRKFVRQDSDSIFSDLSADVVRGLLWVSESGKEYVVVWLFDLPGHSYMSFCKNGDTHYTDIPLFHHQDLHWLDGLSEMVLWGTRLYLSTSRRYVRVLDLSGPQGFFKDITDGQVLLVESDPCNRTCFRLYKKNPDIENPDLFGHTVTEVDSLDGEALLLDLGYTVPANKALGIEPDSIYFTRHYRPCQCASPDLDICVFNLATKTLHRFPDLDKMNLMDARWFLPSGNYAF